MDEPVNNNGTGGGVGGSSRRGTATEFSYILQREVIVINPCPAGLITQW